jgi:hypothetical protein
VPTNSAKTFDSKNGGHGAKSAFAHPTDCLPKSISECTSYSDERGKVMAKFAKELITSLTQAAKHARGGKVKGMRVKAVELPDVKAVRRPLRMSQMRNPDRCPSHPGAVLDDIMPSLGKPKA